MIKMLGTACFAAIISAGCGGGSPVGAGDSSEVRSDGVTIELIGDGYTRIELVVFDDDNDNGKPDEGETIYRRFNATNPGRSWRCGPFSVDAGPRRKPPVLRITAVMPQAEITHVQNLPDGHLFLTWETRCDDSSDS